MRTGAYGLPDLFCMALSSKRLSADLACYVGGGIKDQCGRANEGSELVH